MHFNLTSKNITDIEGADTVSSQVQIISLILLIILVITIITGNVLVIVTFFGNGHKIKTVTNYFIVSLAVSDILVGTFSVPFWIWVKTSLKLPVISAHIFTALDIMCGGASIFNLSAITLERLYAVVRPASHRNLLRKKNVIFAVIATVWLMALINSALYFLKVYFNWVNYNLYASIINFLVPALIIFGSYIIIFRVAQYTASEQQRIEQEIKLASMIAIVIALFVLCWLPFFLLNLLYVYCPEPTCDITLMTKSIPYVKFLHYSNSMMNPFVYAFRNSDYREAFKRYLTYFLNKCRGKSKTYEDHRCHETMTMETYVSYKRQHVSLMHTSNNNIEKKSSNGSHVPILCNDEAV